MIESMEQFRVRVGGSIFFSRHFHDLNVCLHVYTGLDDNTVVSSCHKFYDNK